MKEIIMEKEKYGRARRSSKLDVKTNEKFESLLEKSGYFTTAANSMQKRMI